MIIKATVFFVKWLKKQDQEVKDIVRINLDRLKNNNTSNLKLLREGIIELKIHFGQGIRIYMTREGNTLYLLLWGGADKKHQDYDIKKAIQIKKNMEDYNEKERI
jgi:putative addiction module killer protein